MIADVPLGAFLSGGLDSSLVVALMSQLSSRPVETFSLGFKEESFNELSYARLVAERLGTHHREYTVDWDLKELLPPLLEHFGEPFADSSALPQYYLSRATRSEVTVALSGDGADEIFGGYRRYQGRWLAERYNRWPGWAGRWALDWVGAALPEPATYYGFSRRKKLKRFLEYARAVREDESVSWEFFFTAAEKTALYTENFADIIDTARQGDRGEAEPEPASSDPLARMFRKDLRQYLPEDILTKVDRMSMACSLEVRSPFLDHRVVEFAASLPIDMKLRRLQRKYLLRRLGVKLLPEPIAKRPKQGFVVPLVAWFRTALKDWTRDILLSSEALNRGFFRRGAVEEMLRLHEQQRDLSQQLWALLVLELWLQRAAR
jgi:asparagine synthase (glutamine-hydrolysing)